MKLCNLVSCCCNELPLETRESFAQRVSSALDRADLDTFRKLLAPDAQWGDPSQVVPTCQSREEILNWYENARESGVRATVTDTVVLDNHILIGMKMTRISGLNDHFAEDERWQVLTFDNGAITSIRGYSTRDEAELAMATPSPWVIGPRRGRS